MKTLKPYVYKCLENYGNAAIGKKTYNSLGEKAILKQLKAAGFDCYIEIIKRGDGIRIESVNRKVESYCDIIIRIKE